MRGVQLPGHTILLSRALGLLEGLCMDLAPDKTLLNIVQPLLNKRIGSREQITWVWQRIQELAGQYLALPDEVGALKTQITGLKHQQIRQEKWLVYTILLIIAGLFIPEGTIRNVIVILGTTPLLYKFLRK